MGIQNPKFYPRDMPPLITPHLPLIMMTLPIKPLSLKPPHSVNPETLTLTEENTGKTLEGVDTGRGLSTGLYSSTLSEPVDRCIVSL